MQKIDSLVVGALEIGQMPVSIDDLKSFLPGDHVFLALWPEIAGMTILHPLQALNIVERLEFALAQPGDVIECGVFQGVTSILMARLMDIRQSDKKIHLFDSFQGLPEPDRQVDASPRFQKGSWAASRAEVEARLASCKVLDRCIIHDGWFSDTLPRLPEDQRFCFAYIDADLYASTVDCLTHVWPRLGQHCVAVFDDYHHPSGGVRKALDDWLANTGEVIHVGPVSQCFVIRGLSAASDNLQCHRYRIGDQQEILLSFDTLGRNRLFRTLVDRRLQQIRTYEAYLTQYAGLLDGSLVSADRTQA